MVDKWRGQEIYVYPPDTYLKPILVLSRTPTEFAIMFCWHLNNQTLIHDGIKGDWILIQKDGNNKYDEWKAKLQIDDGGDFYFDMFLEHCPDELREDSRKKHATPKRGSEDSRGDRHRDIKGGESNPI